MRGERRGQLGVRRDAALTSRNGCRRFFPDVNDERNADGRRAGQYLEAAGARPVPRQRCRCSAFFPQLLDTPHRQPRRKEPASSAPGSHSASILGIGGTPAHSSRPASFARLAFACGQSLERRPRGWQGRAAGLGASSIMSRSKRRQLANGHDTGPRGVANDSRVRPRSPEPQSACAPRSRRRSAPATPRTSAPEGAGEAISRQAGGHQVGRVRRLHRRSPEGASRPSAKRAVRRLAARPRSPGSFVWSATATRSAASRPIAVHGSKSGSSRRRLGHCASSHSIFRARITAAAANQDRRLCGQTNLRPVDKGLALRLNVGVAFRAGQQHGRQVGAQNADGRDRPPGWARSDDTGPAPKPMVKLPASAAPDPKPSCTLASAGRPYLDSGSGPQRPTGRTSGRSARRRRGIAQGQSGLAAQATAPRSATPRDRPAAGGALPE